MKIFAPKTIEIHSENNESQNEKELKLYLKNNYTTYFNKKKLNYYVTDENQLIITTFEDSIPSLNSEESILIPIYNICRHFIDLELNEDKFSFFAIKEFNVVIIFKNQELIDYQKVEGDENAIELYITTKKRTYVTSSKFKTNIYSDIQLVNNEVDELIDIHSKETQSLIEKEDIVIKKNGLQKILGKVNIELNIANLLKTILIYGTVTGSVYFLYTIFEKSQEQNQKMINKISSFSKKIEDNQKEQNQKFKRLEGLESNLLKVLKGFEDIKSSINTLSTKEDITPINIKIEDISKKLKEMTSLTNKTPILNVNDLKNDLNNQIKTTIKNELKTLENQIGNISNNPININHSPMSKQEIKEVIENELTEKQKLEKEQTRMMQEVISLSLKIKFQSSNFIKIKQGRNEYRLYNLNPVEIRGFKVLYSIDLRNITFIKNEKKVSFKIFENRLVLDKKFN